MQSCSSHAKDDSNPPCARCRASENQSAGRERWTDPVGLPARRNRAHRSPPDARRGARTAPRTIACQAEDSGRPNHSEGTGFRVIVVDASAVTELLLQTELGTRVEQPLGGDGPHALHPPHLLDVRVLSALRRLVLTSELRPERAAEAIEDLGLIRLIRHAHLDFVERAWELRRNVTAYEAMY